MAKSKSLGNVILFLQADSKALVVGLQKMETRVTKWANKQAAAAKRVGRAFGDVGAQFVRAGGAMLASLAPLVFSAVAFDKAMREVNSLLGLSEKEFKVLCKEVLALSASMGIDAVGAAKALYQVASAGVPRDNMISFLATGSKGAIAGVSDTETAVKMLASIVRAYGMEMKDAGKISDIVFKTVVEGRTTFGEIGDAIYNVASVASNAGVSLEEVSAAIATITQTGTPTAVAVTQIRAAINGLIAPNRYMIKQYGLWKVASGDAMIAQYGLQGALEKVASVLKVETKAGLVEGSGAMKYLLASAEGVQAALQITGDNAVEFGRRFAELKDPLGATQAAFEQMEKSTSRQWEKMISNMRVVAIVLGDKLLPTLNGLIEKITQFVREFSLFIELNPNATEKVLKTVAALGAFLVAVGSLALAIKTFLFTYGNLMALFGKMGASAVVGFSAMLVTIGLLATATAAFIEMWTTGDWTQNFVTRFVDQFKIVGEFIDYLSDKVVGLFNDIKANAKELWHALGVLSVAGLLLMISKWAPLLLKAYAFVWKDISTVVGKVITKFKFLFTAPMAALALLSVAASAFIEMWSTGDWTTNWLKRWVDSIAGGEDVTNAFFQGIVDFWTVDLPAALGKAFSAVGQFFKSFANVALTPLSLVVKVLNSIIDTINSMDFSIPDWVPVIGGQDWNFNWPKIPIPQFAKGGTMRRAGLALVGEEGPELVVLPRAAVVRPARAMGGGAGFGAGAGGGVMGGTPMPRSAGVVFNVSAAVHIREAFLRVEADVDRLAVTVAERLARDLRRRLGAQGAFSF